MTGTGRPADHERNRRLQDEFLASFTATGLVSLAAERTGIYPVRHYQWLKQYPDYAERFTQARASVPDGVVESHRKPRRRGYKLGGRRGAEREARQAAFLAALRQTGIIADAARTAGIAIGSYHGWVKTDPEFANQARDIQAHTADIARKSTSARKSAANQTLWADADRRAAHSAKQRARWTPQLRAEQGKRVAEAAKDPAVRAARSQAAHRHWQDPESREHHSRRMRKCWADPEYRAKVAASMARPEVR